MFDLGGSEGTKRIRYEDLVRFHEVVLRGAGLDDFSLEAVTTGLCETSLRGVDSHGVRLLPHYVRSAQQGRKNPKPSMRFMRTFPAIGLLDADNAFGHAAGMRAIDYGIELAKEQGMGAIAVTNSSHPGAMASFALRAARQGYIGFAFTNADSLILSHNGTRPFFGTNPVCMAAPRTHGEPYCLDMATSVIPWNRVLLHKSAGVPLPDGVAADAEGRITTDPAQAAALLPTGSYKGYGLASTVEVLCAIFSGMAFGRHIPAMYKAPMDQPRRLGQFYLVMRADGCVPLEEFAAQLQQMTEEIHAEPAISGESVMLPGDREIREAEHRRARGVPIDRGVAEQFESLAREFGAPLAWL